MEAKFKLGETVSVRGIGLAVVTGIFYQLHFDTVQYQIRTCNYDAIRWHSMITEDLIKPVSDDVE